MSTSAAATVLRESGDSLGWTDYPEGVPVLVVDDDIEVRTVIGRCLRKFKVEIVQAGSLAHARRLLSKKRQQFSMLILDKCLPDGDGVEFWEEIRRSRPDLCCVIITGQGNGQEAHRAIQDGVFDYLPKPFTKDRIRSVVTKRYPGLLKIGDASVVVGPMIDGTDGVVENDGKIKFIAHSPSMISVSIDVTRVASIDNTPVLILAETGCGKEVVARLIHERSSRANQKFVALNCGAINQQLIESTLFGHRKGSFTGAYTDQKGYFEEADGGTVFLDEISETTPEFQVKLLRVLQESCITPVGSTEEIKVDVRVIAATNRNVKESDSVLRKDLYYRLAGREILLPTLKDRSADIIPLAFYFAQQAARKMKKKVWFSAGLIDALKAYSWPGNVRELSSVITALVGRAVGEVENILLVSDLPECVRVEVGDLKPNEAPVIGISEQFKTLAEVEAEHIQRVLRAFGGNMTKAARVLGREPTQFGKMCRSKGWGGAASDLSDADG